ncbi:MAG: carbohydrate binding family 9 domain-containing protein [Cyclobacteriaceae bacterium]|nr:carbohydrate binding family 9 domain-containing protein [Cyclobacteriaceae bacterium]
MIKRSSTPIIIDGVMDEGAWDEADVATDFYMVLPMDTSAAKVRTEIRMTYDDHNIYLIATCYYAMPGPYFVESLRRDFSFGKNDNFIYFMDPFDDQTNGYTFGANAAGAQWDGILYEGGKADLSWDNKWVSEVRNDEEKYVFEMALPFKTIRYKEGILEWGINFSRLDLRTTEKSAWAPVPRQFPTASLAYTGTLVWDQPPPAPGTNVSVIPYVLGKTSRDYITNTGPDYSPQIGADAKIAITSSLNLDLTINPDFSQVDVDRQVTNLDRFELFFPERRQFFLENGDLFGNYGYPTIRPFFSRRIGLGVPIRYGARLSGRINRNWRIGAMDMQTAPVEKLGLPAQNFAVMSIQRRVFSRSNISLLMVNKESIRYTPDPTDSLPDYSVYNRNIGMEYNLASSNNLWTGKALFLKSFSPGFKADDMVQSANLRYSSRNWTIEWQHDYVGKNFISEAGYVPRNNFIRLSPKISYNFFPTGEKILSHGPSLETNPAYKPNLEYTDNSTKIGYNISFRTRSSLKMYRSQDFVKILFKFDPTRSDKDSLDINTVHRWSSWGTEFVSKPQSMFTYGISTLYGGYYAGGSRFNVSADLGYRFQPYVNLSMTTSYNNLQMPMPWGNTVFWLIGPRVDVTMTNKLYFTAFMQYNQQTDNINLNTRFQWRFKPASDLFIVYTDNYLPEPFNVKSRALVVKFTYWISL